MDLPDGDTLTYEYGTKHHDDELSRVSSLKLDTGSTGTGSGSVTVARYAYLGQGRVVGLEYPEADILRNFHGTSSGSYPDLDRFGRLVVDSWEKDLATDVAFYRMDLTYDRNSNILELEDHVHAGFDAVVTVDGRDRVTGFEQGTLTGGLLTNTTREESWVLGQTGNWDAYQLDSDGDGTLELDELRSHNPANEITSRDTDGDLTSDHAPVYSAAGAMTDDDEDYEYVYDAFGRLMEIRETGTSDLVAAYTYNGLGYRIGWHHDVDADGNVDGSDPVYRHVYDPRWRIVGMYRGSDASPKEQWVHHAAGLGGRGGSSYVDAIVLRDKDANTAWGAASDGVLEERIYYCQNWRHDVVALVESTGELVEQVRYSPYGVPFGLPAADADSDGDVDEADVTLITSGGPYDVRRDVDLDGDVDAADAAIATSLRGTVLGLVANSARGNAQLSGGRFIVNGSMISTAHGLFSMRFGRVGIPRTIAEGAGSASLLAFAWDAGSMNSDPDINRLVLNPCERKTIGNCGGGGCRDRWTVRKRKGCALGNIRIVQHLKITRTCVDCNRGGDPPRSRIYEFYELLGDWNSSPPGRRASDLGGKDDCDSFKFEACAVGSKGGEFKVEADVRLYCLEGDSENPFAQWSAPGIVFPAEVVANDPCACAHGEIATRHGRAVGFGFTKSRPKWFDGASPMRLLGRVARVVSTTWNCCEKKSPSTVNCTGRGLQPALPLPAPGR